MNAKSVPESARWSVTPAQARVHFWILFLVSLLLTKLGVFYGNHSLQVPLVNWLNDRSLYPDDPFMDALARYPSALWRLVALLTRVFPLEPTLLVLFVLGRLFALYAAGRLARALAPGSQLAVVASTALFAFPLVSMVGYGTIVERCFEQTGVAIPCFLLAAAAFYERRPMAWAVWLAAGFNLTSLYGTYALSYFGAAFLVEADYRRAWKSWIVPALLFFVLASYGIYLSLLAARFSPSDEASWFVAAKIRGWSHYFPLTWPWQHYAQFAVFLGLFGVVLRLTRRETPRLARHAIAWTVVGLVWLLDAFVAPYALESRRLMMMQPARATDLLICLGGVAMIAVTATRLEEPSVSIQRPWWLIVLGAAFLIWLVPGAKLAGAFLVLLAVPRLGFALARWLSPRRLAYLLVAWVAMSAVSLATARWSRTQDARQVVLRAPGAMTRQLAIWAEANTPVDAVFLINPEPESDLHHFMGLAKRSIFTSDQNGTALHWAPDFASDWMARLEALGVELEYRHHWSLADDFESAFASLTDDHVARLKESHRVSHWLVLDPQPSRFPVVWEYEDFRLLRVQ